MVLSYDLSQDILTGYIFNLIFPQPVHLKSVKLCYSYDKDFSLVNVSEYASITAHMKYKSLLTSNIPIISPVSSGPDYSSMYIKTINDTYSFCSQNKTEPSSSLISFVNNTSFDRKLFQGSDYVKEIRFEIFSDIILYVNNFYIYLLVEYDLIDKLPNM